MKDKKTDKRLLPPEKSNNLFADIYKFLLHKPDKPTLIRFTSPEERDNYNQRVLQRTGMETEKYSVLNIHKIGVDVPASFVFKELEQWNGHSSCWPNHIARVERVNNNLEHIRILPMGWKKYPLGFKNSFFGFRIIPLFLLNAIRIKPLPDAFDFDNARYILYNCTGGYPIGIFIMYVRSSIPEMGEYTKSQLAFAVSFNFYGKVKKTPWHWLVNKIWESVHNRVTANVLNRMKQLAEWRFSLIEKNR